MTKANIYLGLSDKDSKTQLVTTESANQVVNALIIKEFGGGTVINAAGVYRHENGQMIVENTIKIELLLFSNTIEQVKAFCMQLKKRFNQESVALQIEQVSSELI